MAKRLDVADVECSPRFGVRSHYDEHAQRMRFYPRVEHPEFREPAHSFLNYGEAFEAAHKMAAFYPRA